MSVHEHLKAARELISEPSRWTKGSKARNIRGNPRPARSHEAVQWCTTGALEKACEHGDCILTAFLVVMRCCPSEYVTLFNDSPETTHKDIMEMFDRAIFETLPEGDKL